MAEEFEKSAVPTGGSKDVLGIFNGGLAVAMTLLGFERDEAAATAPVTFKGEVDR
jgi:hypothetical protein